MSNENMRSEIQERFKQVDKELSPCQYIIRLITALNALVATTQIITLAHKGCETPTVMKAVAFGASAIATGISSKDVVLWAQNNQLLDILHKQDKTCPELITQNRQTQKSIVSLLKYSTIFAGGSWLFGGMDWSSFCFAAGSIFMSGCIDNYHLEKKNRKILAAEFPRGILNERTR